MKFKLVEDFTKEEFDEAQLFVSEVIYDAIDNLGDASLEDYQEWFKSEFIRPDDINLSVLDVAVKDMYINAVDCGKIKRPKTMITSELTTYLESNADLIDKDIDELIDNCPDHLKHELTLVLDKIDDSLTEELLTEEKYLKVDISYPVNVESNDLGVPSEAYDYVYVIVDNKDANVSAINTMFDTGKYKHETVDNYWRDLLKQSAIIHNMTEVTLEDIYADPDFETHLYIKTNRKLRNNTRKNVLTELDNDSSFKAAVGNYAIYVHHPDENELNTDVKDNSYILYNGNKYFPIVIHQLLHMTHVDPRILGNTGKTYIPVVIFDKSFNKYVKRQIEVSLSIR